ncbi:MAG: HAMP domain-containing sensor histidine kinase [Clostridium sp.]|uniref:sensor histidine kinase n=1 Tax=Clostridium sp. TaxID=1506 RepID=UPI00290C3093|nr:HAMP domain-containing sensor histidine kinase [Clostridium sp.]MDU4937721.1 HAMP domain-containing sensor histidine kinase [Clostridium sp.]
MKLKLTFRYVFSIAIVAVLVVLINISMLYLLANNKNALNDYSTDKGISRFVRGFGKYIDLGEDDKLYINDNGKNLIDQSNAWIQILDENNKEVYSYNKPEEIKDKHTPIDIINGYKYAGGLGGTSQILAGYKDIDNATYTYLIGYPSNIIKKYLFVTETDTMNTYIKYEIISIILVDFIIAIIIGYIFSKGLTKPVKNIIDGVDHLYNGNYEIYFKEKGIYANVFKKLNSLSNKLEENELERKKIDKMRDEWIANISHDIKTPLSSIKGYAEFLEQDYDFSSDDIKSYAEIINNKSDYIKELVDDLNLSMKLKNNKSILKKEKVNIVSLVKNSVIDILNDSRYSEVDIRVEYSEDRIFIDIDRVLIQRVLNNLIYNALVHNDENISIVVSVYKNDNTYITISDNGKGISESDLENIFDRYYRGTNTGEAHRGSGLGMSIVKQIVNAHNGDIKINSILGKGTDIEIIL